MFRQSRESKISDILRMIDDNPSNWKKAAFYSDDEILPLLEDLQRRWEESNNEGIPIDYATDEELDLLLAKARKYYYMSEAEAVSLVMARQQGLRREPDRGEQGGSRIRGFIDRIRGRRD